MLDCLDMEASCLPRPRSQLLPSSLRSPPLHGACITQGFVSGDSKLPAHCPHAPAFHLGHSTSQPTCQMTSQGETWERKEVPGVEQGWKGSHSFFSRAPWTWPLRGAIAGEVKEGKNSWVAKH